MSNIRITLFEKIDYSYNVEIGTDLDIMIAKDLSKHIIKGVNKYAIITDSVCKKLYGDKLLKQLKGCGLNCFLFSFEAGEKNKSRKNKAYLEDLLILNQFNRDSCLIALGGGTVTDLVGFIAATYCRGIPVIYYVTTILAAVDASIGGKTAIDTPVATNYIGAIKQPDKVYIDIDKLKTLSARQVLNGISEIVIHACIADVALFNFLESNIRRLINENSLMIYDLGLWEYLIEENIKIKSNIVNCDVKENGIRKILNLGHTIGRALESLTKYQLNHGEAISIGLRYQSEIAVKLCVLEKKEKNRIIKLLSYIGLPIDIPKQISSIDLIEKMHTDKKVRNNKIEFVLLEQIGEIYKNKNKYTTSIEDDVLLEMIEEIRKRSIYE